MDSLTRETLQSYVKFSKTIIVPKICLKYSRPATDYLRCNNSCFSRTKKKTFHLNAQTNIHCKMLFFKICIILLATQNSLKLKEKGMAFH